VTVEFAVRVETAYQSLRAIVPPEHFESACLEARRRGTAQGMDLAAALESVYDDAARGTFWRTPDFVIKAGTDDATTCPGCRVAVPLGQFCRCPMRWKG